MRKIISPEQQQEIVQKYMEGYSITDLCDEYQFSYAAIRQSLVVSMNACSPHQERKRLWNDKKFLPMNVRSNQPQKNRKMVKSKSIPVVLDLLFNKELNHSQIAKKNFCSREYVGQCAEACALHGQDVWRETKHGKDIRRGKVV